MRKLLVAAMLLPAGLLLTGASPAPRTEDDILVKLAEKATELYREQGYSRTGWSNQGELAQGGEKRYSVTLSGGSAFSLVGMCDTNCGDLNLKLAQFSGEEVASDVEPDDFPIVNTGRAGLYYVTVTMVKCSGTCRYSLIGFSK